MTLKSPLRGIQASRRRHDALYGGGLYYQKVLRTGPIAYWPLWETAGVTAHCLVNPAQDGTYNSPVGTWPPGDGIGDGNTAPFFDGVNDAINVFSATLAAAVNGSEGSLMLWHKVAGAGTWTDGQARQGCWFSDPGANNYFYTWKRNLVNRFRWQYSAGGVVEIVERSPATTTDWFQAVLTWSSSADEVKGYFNGVQEGLTQTVLGAWGAAITVGIIGANTLGPPPINPWDGWLAHCALWDRALSQSEIDNLRIT